MKRTIDATNYRREKQMKYNIENDITPTQIIKASREIIGYASIGMKVKGYSGDEPINLAADPVVQYMSIPALEKAIAKLKKDMEAAAKELDFYEAARLRDEMFRYQEILKEKKK